jgi:hypothetical protein
MRDADRFRLRYGSYRTPRFRYGSFVQCAMRGELRIVGITDGPIPWPLGRRKGTGATTLVIYRDLAKALRRRPVVRREADNRVVELAQFCRLHGTTVAAFAQRAGLE